MTDTAAIRARHVPYDRDAGTGPERGPDDPIWCAWCHDPWPCDAHQLGVALEEMTIGRNEAEDASIEWADALEAAEAREQRLRAAFEEAMLHVAGAKRRASIRALATEAESTVVVEE